MATDPVGYAQNAFEVAYLEAETARRPLRRSSIVRRMWAYGLKGVAVFGGMAIASGLVAQYAQLIGITVAVAVAIDGLFSNHVQMMLVSKAANAYRRLTNQARRAHQLRLAPILAIKEQQPEESQRQLLALLTELTAQLHNGCTEVESALDEGRIKALDTLSLDSERSKPSTPVSG